MLRVVRRPMRVCPKLKKFIATYEFFIEAPDDMQAAPFLTLEAKVKSLICDAVDDAADANGYKMRSAVGTVERP